MTPITLEPISSAADIPKVAEVVLIKAVFRGQFCISDFEWDDDEIATSFIEMTEDFDLRAAYLAERDLVLTEAKEYTISALADYLQAEASALGDGCPFIVDKNSDVLISFKGRENLDPLGTYYIANMFFSAQRRANPWVNMNHGDAEKCRLGFAKLFEIASCVALAGLTGSRVWYLGRSRSVRRLLRILRAFCTFIGSGSPNDAEELDRYVARSNDGGVDALGVTVSAGKLASSPMIHLLSATIQSGNRKNKILGNQEKSRFRSLFRKQPNIALEGSLSIPFEADEVDLNWCRDSDCRYIPRPAVIEGIRAASENEYVSKSLRPVYYAIKAWTDSVIDTIILDIDGEPLHIS